jgi:hypothetical protein
MIIDAKRPTGESLWNINDVPMTSDTPHFSRRSFVEKSALALGLLGPLATIEQRK